MLGSLVGNSSAASIKKQIYPKHLGYKSRLLENKRANFTRVLSIPPEKLI